MCSFFSKSDLAAEIKEINDIVDEKVKVIEENCKERDQTNKDALDKMAGSLKEVQKASKEKQLSFFNLIEELKEKLSNALTEHKMWEEKVDRIIKSSESEELKEKQRQKVLELVGKVDKSESEFEAFREMFQQVFHQDKSLDLARQDLKSFC